MSGSWPRRPRLVAGNWKMNKTAREGVSLARELIELLRARPACEVAVCPPYTALEAVGAELRGSSIHLGAQDLHWEAKGAFTGEVSGEMLSALGCSLVIVGHSERRHGLGEDDATVGRKLRSALRESLTPIVCVGETLAERDQGREAEVVVRQIQAAYDGLTPDQAAGTIVAYEPVWAIGTGRAATPQQAAEAHRVIRAALDRVAGSGAGARAAVLYGGSVTADSAAELFAEQDLDGALVGGASLTAATFWKIAAAAGA